MGRLHRTFRILRGSLILVAIAVAGLSPVRTSSNSESATDLSGNPVDPFKAAPGKVVVLIFVRTDCPVSKRYSPTIQLLSAQYADKVAFWLVYPGKIDTPDLIRKHDQEFGYKLPALRDLQRALVKQSRAQVTPEAAVFDVSRRLVYHGRIDDLYADFGRARPAPTTHELDDAIRAALAGKTLPAESVPAVGCYISDLE
jgi:thiol-disulfide isomerase/thioredoxin